MHSGLKAYKCDDCDWKFAQVSALNVHKKTQTKGETLQMYPV